jgi:hypothetical protein
VVVVVVAIVVLVAVVVVVLVALVVFHNCCVLVHFLLFLIPFYLQAVQIHLANVVKLLLCTTGMNLIAISR